MNYKEQYAPEISGGNETVNVKTTNEKTTNEKTTNETSTNDGKEVVITSVDELKQFLLEHADGTTIVSISMGKEPQDEEGGEN